MTAPLQPSTLDELVDAVKSAPQVIPVGAGTKANLSAVPNAVPISTARLSGVLDYGPTEFTFTALAGTPVREIIAALAKEGQYLPFDPPFAAAGSTLGGMVAAGLNGSGRLRFGGLRDFILGVRFVDGQGQLLRMGGKVVKNAAGFDLPKFFVGSLGRFGVLGEITFKVFPKPTSTLTLEFPVTNDAALIELFSAAAQGRWELEALDASLHDRKIYARLGGPPQALQLLAAELGERWPARVLAPEAAHAVWQSTDEFSWAHPRGILCKFPLTLARVAKFAELSRSLPEARAWIAAAGNVGYLSLAETTEATPLDEALRKQELPAMVWRGRGPLWLGPRPDFRVHAAVKHALDPQNKFPPLG
jgi:glycolate oxidase FAD binding subunit